MIITKPKHKIIEKNKLQVIIELIIPENLYYFKGHFEEHAILPGVVQIDWVMFYAKQYLNISGDFMQMELIKFNKIIEPSYHVILKISLNVEQKKLRFSYESDHGKHSSGIIVLK
ncbi:MAG: hypothetical protein KAH77_09140 [Thiomargarita sp.]|nr:hypothetical protein [Thiomargarita sp.]